IQDVLLTLAQLGRFSVIFDDTVKGTTTHYFRDLTVDDALNIVAQTNNFYISTIDGIRYISKIKIVSGEMDNTYSVDAENVSPGSFLDALSRESRTPILHSSLPSQNISIHSTSLSLKRILTIVISKFPNYELISKSDFFSIQRISENGLGSGFRPSGIQRKDDRYSADGVNLRFTDLIDELFDLAGKEYLLLKDTDIVLNSVRYTDKTFDELLSIFLELGGADVRQQGNLYYILDLRQDDIVNRHSVTVQVPLRYLRAESLPSLFPGGLISNNAYKIDNETNKLILNGTSGELVPVLNFIEELDRPLANQKYYRFEFIGSAPQDVIGILPERLRPSRPLIVPGQNALIMLTNQEKSREIQSFINLLNAHGAGSPVRLRYIRSEQLLQYLPPSVSRKNIVETADPTLVFFTGSESMYELFMRELDHIDTPIPQIRYQVLVIQFQDREQFTYAPEISNSRLTESENTAGSSFIGAIGELLTLDFDIVSNFGYGFALDLNWSLARSESRILIDSGITGLSGEEVSFQNTNISRFRSTETSDNSEESQVTTLEISSGLNVNITGWSSGDGMITMDVSASFSRNFDDADAGSNLPSTNERLIKTHARTRSGESVVIGGLISQEASNSKDGTPLLSDIPVLGNLFSNRGQNTENTELRVYIIPYLEYPFGETTTASDLFKLLYREHMGQ
ncbi:MAG: type II secretion system protein GspD, partial [Salinispira sp.]